MSEDMLRDELAEVVRAELSYGSYQMAGDELPYATRAREVADALLPTVRRAVEQARAEQVRPLMPAEHMVYTVAHNQIRRGDNPPINTTAGLLLTVERLAGIEQADDEQEAPDA